jgi:hypothetical protein
LIASQAQASGALRALRLDAFPFRFGIISPRNVVIHLSSLLVR